MTQTKRAVKPSPEVLTERELCARIAEGRAIFHREQGKPVQQREAEMIAACIRDRRILD